MKTESKRLSLILSLLLTLICLTKSTDSFPQNRPLQNPSQKISVEREQLVELTKMAKLSLIFQKQNTALILENNQLKTNSKTLKQALETTNADLGNYQKKWRYALMVISLFVVGLLVKIFRR